MVSDRTNQGRTTANNGARTTNRRRFIKTVGGGAAVSLTGLAGCAGGEGDTGSTTAQTTAQTTNQSGSDDELADELQFYSWGGSTQEALTKHVIEPFQEEYGVTVKQSSFSSQDKMVANIRSSPEGSYDVVMPAVAGAYNAVQQDLLEPIRTENVDTWDNVLPTFQDFKVIRGSDSTFVAPIYYGTIGMVHNTDEVSGSPPFSWQKTWDEQFAGQMTLEGFAFVRVFTTALALGMDPNTIEGDDGTYESGIQAVYDAMAEQHDLVKTYWTSGQEQTTLYSNGTAHIGDGWSGRIIALQDDGYDNIQYSIPEEGAYGWGDSFAIAKGSQRRYTAEKFIEFTYRSDVMEGLSPQIGYPPATDATNGDIEALPDYDPTGGERLVFQDQEFKGEHQDDWSSTFEQIKLGQY